MTRAQVLKGALELDPVERELLLAELNQSLYGDEGPPISEEWLAEIRRRSEELRSGKVKGVTAAEVHRRLRAKHASSKSK